MKKILLFFLAICLLFSLSAPNLAEGEVPGLKEPEISAEKAVIINAKNGNILYGKNETTEGYCGFLPRLMTCVLLAESGQDLETEITIAERVDSLTAQRSSAELCGGDKISLADLMSAVLVGNAQEAAYAIALYLEGSADAFIEKMNTRAKELGATNTVFTEPAGYYKEGTKAKTTALDAAKIAAHASTFESIVDKSNISTANLTVNGKRRILYTRNALIDRNDASFSANASGLAVHGDARIGSSMVSTNNSTGSRFIAVSISTKGVTETFSDIKKLLDFSVDSFHVVTLITKATPVAEIKVSAAKDKDSLILITQNNVDAMMQKDIDPADIERTVNIPETLQAPVEKGTKVGTVTLSYQGEVYGEADLVAQTSAELDLVESYTAKISEFFQKTIVKFVIAVLLLLVLLYIFFTFMKNRKSQKKKKITNHDRLSFSKPKDKK